MSKVKRFVKINRIKSLQCVKNQDTMEQKCLEQHKRILIDLKNGGNQNISFFLNE